MSVVVLHVCPVCNREHRVAPARIQFAYGHQLACGPDCEAERRRRLRAQYPRLPGPLSACAPTLKPITMADPDIGHWCAAQHAPRHIYAIFTRPALQCSSIDSTGTLDTSSDDMDAPRRKSSRAASGSK